MNFKMGGGCLCIRTHSGVGGKVAYIKGHKYPILGLKQGCTHTPLLIDIGETFFDVTYCSECNNEAVGNYFHAANIAILSVEYLGKRYTLQLSLSGKRVFNN